MSAIDIIRAANNKNPLRVEIELPGGVKCWMHIPNRHQISDVQEKLYRIAYAEATELGLCGKPINQAEWEKSIAGLKEKERNSAVPPADLAEQYARVQSVAQAVYNLIPVLVRDDNGADIFPTLEEKRAFLREIQRSQELESYLLDKWREVFGLREQVRKEAKN